MNANLLDWPFQKPDQPDQKNEIIYADHDPQEKSSFIREPSRSPGKTKRWENVLWERRLDKVSRVAFPAAFAVFNVIYWSFYLLTDFKF